MAKKSSIERLEELLNSKDSELDGLREKVARLERELRGALNGWRQETIFEDDGVLPVPRLELVYTQDDEWRSYRVTYRLVTKHLCGQLVALPLSFTTCSGNYGNQIPNGLPVRDGAHIAHDSAHLRCSAFKIVPGSEPERLSFDSHPYQYSTGAGHRRE